MNGIVGVIVGFITAVLSVFGLGHSNVSAPPAKPQAVRVERPATPTTRPDPNKIEQTTPTFSIPSTVTLSVGQMAMYKLSDGYSAEYIKLNSLGDNSAEITFSEGCWTPPAEPNAPTDRCGGGISSETIPLNKSTVVRGLTTPYLTLTDVMNNIATIKITAGSNDQTLAVPGQSTSTSATSISIDQPVITCNARIFSGTALDTSEITVTIILNFSEQNVMYKNSRVLVQNNHWSISVDGFTLGPGPFKLVAAVPNSSVSVEHTFQIPFGLCE